MTTDDNVSRHMEILQRDRLGDRAKILFTKTVHILVSEICQKKIFQRQ